MKVLIVAVALAAISNTAFAQYGGSNRGSSYGGYGTGSNPRSNSVDGYYNNSGTYVQPHQRTNPNSTQYDNYGTRGNYNPYTGQTGTRSPRY
jgi:hypothetical protein